MTFLRKAFNRRKVNQSDGTTLNNTGTVADHDDVGSLIKDFGFKARLGAGWSSSTSLLDFFQYDKNVSMQNGTARGVSATPTQLQTSVCLTEDQITDKVYILSPSERVLSSPATMEASHGQTTPDQTVVETDEEHLRNGRSTKKKISTSTFPPFLTNLAGFKLSPTADNPTYPSLDEDHDSCYSTPRQQSASFGESYPGPSTPGSSTLPSAHDDDIISPLPFLSSNGTRRRNRKKKLHLDDQVGVLQSVAELNDSVISNGSPSSSPSSAVPDPYLDIVKTLVEAAKQARLNAEKVSESPLIQDQEFSDPSAKNLSSSFIADKAFSNPFNLTPKPESDSVNKRVEIEQESRDSEDELKPLPHTDHPELESLLGFLSSPTLNNDIAVPPLSPLPIPDETHLKELRSLRLELEQTKARIDSLARVHSWILRDHRQEVDNFKDQLKEQETLIKQLTSDRDRAIDKADSLDLLHKELENEKEDILQQLEYQVEENYRLEKENQELQKECLVLRELKQKMRNHETEYQELSREGLGMRKQLDAVQHKLSEAERRVRCLDQLSRKKYEAKQEGAYGSVGRSILLYQSPHVKGPSMDVINAVDAFNGEILQAASLLVESLERKPSSWIVRLPSDATRAKKIWGSKVVEMLEEQARNPSGFNFLLMQNCLEVFITHWCVEIIEGWYPIQPSILDVLVELASQSGTTSTTNVKPHICGKRIKVITTDSADPEFNTWVQEMVQDISSLLRVGGFMIRSSQPDLLSTKFHPIVKLAYDLRLALAERDICGTLELAAPFPDSPFHPEFMEEEHTLERSRKKKGSSSNSTWYGADYIAGTSAIGLKRINGEPGIYEMVLKPKVVLIRVLAAS